MTQLPPRALCWDADGVLVDTEPLYFEAWRRLMAELGHTFELAEYLPLAGLGGREILLSLCGKRGITQDIDHLRARRVAIYREIRAGGVPVILPNVQLVHQFARPAPSPRRWHPPPTAPMSSTNWRSPD